MSPNQPVLRLDSDGLRLRSARVASRGALQVTNVQKFPHERLRGVDSSSQGLTTTEAAARLERFGRNEILEAGRRGWATVVQETVRDPMLWFLLSTSALFAVAGEWTEAAVLLAAMVPFFGMDAFLHRRTQASIEGLSSLLCADARVIRDGREVWVPAIDLVPGDVARRWRADRSRPDSSR